jgi:hypothetical protein
MFSVKWKLSHHIRGGGGVRAPNDTWGRGPKIGQKSVTYYLNVPLTILLNAKITLVQRCSKIIFGTQEPFFFPSAHTEPTANRPDSKPDQSFWLLDRREKTEPIVLDFWPNRMKPNHKNRDRVALLVTYYSFMNFR